MPQGEGFLVYMSLRTPPDLQVKAGAAEQV